VNATKQSGKTLGSRQPAGHIRCDLPNAAVGKEDEMSAESRSEATWRGFFTAVISAGVGTVVGMITGFILGSLADLVVLAATGHEHVHYGYVLAEAGTYLGLFVGIVVGIGSTATSPVPKKTIASSGARIGRPSDGSGVRPAGIEQVRLDGKRDRAYDDHEDLGGAAA